MATLNRAGRSYASSLISDGKVDKTSAWSFTAQDGDALLGADGSDWANYGKNHLGADPTENFDSKAHWKYPFAKDGKVYRSGLIAARQRAGQQRDSQIESAAGALLDEIDGDSDRTHENEAGATPRADMITIRAKRPPCIELDIRGAKEMCEPGLTDESLNRFRAGLRPAAATAPASIEMFGVIGESFWDAGVTAGSVKSQLKALNDQDVEVLINSPGGDMFEGIAIFNLLNQYAGKVTVKVLGLAASAASVIAMAGDDILIGQGAFLMIHNCWVMAIGNRHDMQDVANYLGPFDDALADIYATRSGQKKPACATMMDNETYLNASQCVEKGFATGILPAADITEDAEATKKSKALQSRRTMDMALARAGVPRSERRAILRAQFGTQDAAELDSTTRTAGADDGMRNAAGSELLVAAMGLLALN